MKKLICLIMIAVVAMMCGACNDTLSSDGTSGKQTSLSHNDDKQQSEPEKIVEPEDDDSSYDEKSQLKTVFMKKQN